MDAKKVTPNDLVKGELMECIIIDLHKGYGALIRIEGIEEAVHVDWEYLSSAPGTVLAIGQKAQVYVVLHVNRFKFPHHDLDHPEVVKLQGCVHAVHNKVIMIRVDEDMQHLFNLNSRLISAYRPSLSSDINRMANIGELRPGSRILFQLERYKDHLTAINLERVDKPAVVESEVEPMKVPDQAEIAAAMTVEFEEAVSSPKEQQ